MCYTSHTTGPQCNLFPWIGGSLQVVELRPGEMHPVPVHGESIPRTKTTVSSSTSMTPHILHNSLSIPLNNLCVVEVREGSERANDGIVHHRPE